jgi:hypothetical protein
LRRLAAAVLALALASTAQAQATLTEAQVRDFLVRQQRAWNAGDVDRYFALYAPTASFSDQARTPQGQIVPYGTSTLAQAKAQARRFFAKAKVTETGYVQRIDLAPDGRSARVFTSAVSRTDQAGKVQATCVARVQTLTLAAGRLRSTGQTDTLSRCPRQAAAAPGRTR